VEEFYALEAAPRGLVACDNLGGLNKSKQCRRKVPPSVKHADILQVLRWVHGRLKGVVSYKHVYGHQLRRKKWHQMSLLEQLNEKCDILAKDAVHRGIHECPTTGSISQQMLPLESAAIFYEGNKIVGEC
jgi:pyruvate-formate lyase-activating enzyme